MATLVLPNVPTELNSKLYQSYLSDAMHWQEWRICYDGGFPFRDRYLEEFSSRETATDFHRRKRITPIPNFVKPAVNEMRNSIFQRFNDIIRQGGSLAYQAAIAGQLGGVDNRGSSMNSFIGQLVLTELMVMGRVGVFVDMPPVVGETLKDAAGKRPYLYVYPVEDILNWVVARPESPSEFTAVLLRDWVPKMDPSGQFAIDRVPRYRMLWVAEDGYVNVQFFDEQGGLISRDGVPGGPEKLKLTRIPFVMPTIGDSLIKDVVTQQIALLNLGSSDVNYALQSNFPFYTEQRDARAVGQHLKSGANEDGTATAGGQGAASTAITVGATQGRTYDLKAERPGFINPSPEPLRASLELQEKLKHEIRELISLAIMTVASRASAESKEMDNRGLEAGLSFIGLVLQATEQQIAEHWAAYEHVLPSQRKIAVIKYPERYSLKTDIQRLKEAGELLDVMNRLPSTIAKKEVAKLVVIALLSGKVSPDVMFNIQRDIDASPFATSDLDTIIKAREASILSDETAAVALGFTKDEATKAAEDHAARIARINAAQTPDPNSDPAARGNPDASANPERAGAEEKAASRDTTESESVKKPVRGEGK